MFSNYLNFVTTLVFLTKFLETENDLCSFLVECWSDSESEVCNERKPQDSKTPVQPRVRSDQVVIESEGFSLGAQTGTYEMGRRIQDFGRG